ncbi:hypothetical protein V8C40DRAFT_269088 [Trichoderma camerunense]
MGNFAQFPIISQLDDNGSGTGSITIGRNVYTIHSDTDVSGGISCSRLFGEAILLIECDATIPATVQLIPVAAEDLSTCVTDTFFSAVLENEALQPALDPRTEGSSTDFNSTDFNSTELDTELSERQTPSPCTQWSPFTEEDGDGSPTQSMQFIQLSENIFCGAANECSAGREDSTSYTIGFSGAGALTRWASVGFAVEQSRSTAIYNEENESLAKVVSFLSHKNLTLKILEVGGSTGSATRKVLPSLSGQGEIYRGYDTYTLTEIGTGSFAASLDTHKECGGMRYAQLDVQQPVTEQSKPEASIYPQINALSDIKGRHTIGDIDCDSKAPIFAETSAAELLEDEIEIDIRAMDFSNNELPLASPNSKRETGFVARLSLVMPAPGSAVYVLMEVCKFSLKDKVFIESSNRSIALAAFHVAHSLGATSYIYLAD